MDNDIIGIAKYFAGYLTRTQRRIASMFCNTARMFYYKIVSNSSNQGPLSIGADWAISPPMICPFFFFFLNLQKYVLYPLHIMHISCCPMFLKYQVIWNRIHSDLYSQSVSIIQRSFFISVLWLLHFYKAVWLITLRD